MPNAIPILTFGAAKKEYNIAFPSRAGKNKTTEAKIHYLKKKRKFVNRDAHNKFLKVANISIFVIYI